MSYLAEKSVIGSLLMDQTMIVKVHGNLKPDMFKDPLLQAVYTEFLRASDNGYVLDPVQIMQKLSEFPDDILMSTLKSCLSEVDTSVLIDRHAEVIINEFKADTLGKIINGVHPGAYDINRQIGSLINDLELLLQNKKSESKSLSEIVLNHQSAYFCETETEKTYTGFERLDDMIGGLEGGDVIVIGARPAVGKSALVTQIALNLAEKRKKVGFYNLEMRDKQIYERLVSSASRISLTRVRRAKTFLGGERERFDDANKYLANLPVVVSSGAKTVSEIRNESRYMGYDCIIIDYLQLVRADVRYQNRFSEVGAISKAVKSLAMELNIPIIALSQLNRTSEIRETKEPAMSELREAGDIEQDASIIILMWNLDEKDWSKKGLKVDKNRQGTIGKIPMRFNGELMRFCEAEEQSDTWKAAGEDNPFRR